MGPPRETEWLLGVLSARREWYGSTTLADLKKLESALNGDAGNGINTAAAAWPKSFCCLAPPTRRC